MQVNNQDIIHLLTICKGTSSFEMPKASLLSIYAGDEMYGELKIALHTADASYKILTPDQLREFGIDHLLVKGDIVWEDIERFLGYSPDPVQPVSE